MEQFSCILENYSFFLREVTFGKFLFAFNALIHGAAKNMYCPCTEVLI